MTQKNRIAKGLVDQASTISFQFNGRTLSGFKGDTLASALLANGEKLVGRSFKYHRPRGIFTAGSEEPNALMQLHDGAYSEPNSRATVTELFEGLQAKSQNHLGSLKYDLMAPIDLLSPFLSAGFYYKTFMWPKAFWEKLYEPLIRNSAGLGTLSGKEDPDKYDKGFLHCDVLVIGAGPAGIMAALTAGRAGAKVILADEDFLSGGRLNAEKHEIDGQSGHDWAADQIAEIKSMKNVRMMARTTVLGAYDHGVYSALERKRDHLAPGPGQPRQVLWRIYSKQAILCAGSTERIVGFGNNDRPGIMQAGAVRAYLNRWGVACGKCVAIFTNNDDGWNAARDLEAAGVELAAVIDSRSQAGEDFQLNTRKIFDGRIVDTKGRGAINSLKLANGEIIETDCLGISGGWSPNVHLSSHQGSRPIWRADINAFVPGENLPMGMHVAGAAKGYLPLAACLKSAQLAADDALSQLGIKKSGQKLPETNDEPSSSSAFWFVEEAKSRGWIDLQNDVTAKDIKLAHQEGYRSVEHLKRYTTLGMATDQGKTGNIPAMAIMAKCTGKTIEQTGTTMFRPPYTPVPIGAYAGRSRGDEFRPTRHAPSHDWAKNNGADFVETGMWKRAQWFTKPGETHWRQSVDREVLQTRKSVGICDVSTLGKIDIQGKDAAEFLNKIYANAFAKLAIGKTRYGLMLREDGIAMDDGTTARFSETHFVMTTTTANAVSVFRHMEFCRQCLWPDMDVHLISATEQWAQYAVAGPNSRKLLQNIVDPDFDISNEAFAFMACANITVCGGTPARLFRISFSGELAFEIAVPSRYGDDMIAKLMNAGEVYEAVAYGTEALGVMRIEKGHVAGNELNGQTTALNLGLERMVSKKKDYIGSVLRHREALVDENIVQLAGFKAVDPQQSLVSGSHFVDFENPSDMAHDLGWMSSVAYSPMLECSIGLGFIKHGNDRHGEKVRAVNPLKGSEVEVEIVSPHFFDPEGERLRG